MLRMCFSTVPSVMNRTCPIPAFDRVDAMGGKLTLRSPLAEGTSLVIELPLEPTGELDGCGCAHLHLCRWMGDIHQGGS